MFDSATGPRLYAVPPGVDFGQELIRGLTDRFGDGPPDRLARVELYVNTRRMQRRLRESFDAGPARLLPRIRLITDLASDPVASPLPLPVPPLRRRLELAQLVTRLIVAEPDLAPERAAFDLAESLSRLLDEMHGEGVAPGTLDALDVTDASGHWQRALRFLRIVNRYLRQIDGPPNSEARQRDAVERLAARWAEAPPDHPVVCAGSTGSRGATALFMEAVARLPRGAVILPGFDFDMDPTVWDRLDDPMQGEDHPQFRFRALCNRLGLAPGDVARWTEAAPAAPSRNRLVSLALRPAPVTDQWLTEGPMLDDLEEAVAGLTLVEAPSVREEAESIALGLRQALEDGRTAALITPDRSLTRQVAAALDRWNIVPDDSAGTPLHLTPPGRFLRHVAEIGDLTAEAMLVLLKHPLCHSGADRNAHLLRTRRLELAIRRHGPAFPTGADLLAWGADQAEIDTECPTWAGWLASLIDRFGAATPRPIGDHVRDHLALAGALAGGIAGGSGALWEAAAGRAAQEAMAGLAREAEVGGEIDADAYRALLLAVLSGVEVRDRDAGHPDLRIWGTLEARVQGADLIVLGAMNEGAWPEAPAPDPWLNRRMRFEAGLLLPERRIGLAAHDFQQAVAGPEVWITRAIRSDEAQTVPSRWVNRLTNLLNGLDGQGGPDLLKQMRARGAVWLARARALAAPDRPIPPATRPSPRPPVAYRPKQLSVTQISTLIRDPFAIYAREILGLRALDPLQPSADAALRGTLIHRVMERFVRGDGMASDDPRTTLLAEAEAVLAEACPWPTARRLWLARVIRFADWFLQGEAERQALAEPIAFESRGKLRLNSVDFTLICKADRIDRQPDGATILYDYKTGQVPTGPQQERFDKQLLLEAAMVERGGFAEIGPARAAGAAFIGLGASLKVQPAPLDTAPPDKVWAEFEALIAAWQRPERGYTARLAHFRDDQATEYDHLARLGEWDLAEPAAPEDLK